MRKIMRGALPVVLAIVTAAAGPLFGRTETDGVVKRETVLHFPPDPQGEIRTDLPLGEALEVPEIAADGIRFHYQDAGRKGPTIFEDSGYPEWERDLKKAKLQRITGVILSATGVVILVPSMLGAIAALAMKNGLGIGKILIGPALVGVAVGLLVIETGIIVGSSAKKKLKLLNEEGETKGYLRAGLVTEYGAVGFQIGAKF